MANKIMIDLSKRFYSAMDKTFEARVEMEGIYDELTAIIGETKTTAKKLEAQLDAQDTINSCINILDDLGSYSIDLPLDLTKKKKKGGKK